MNPTKNDALEMRQAADEIWQLSKKYHLETRNFIKNFVSSMHAKARQIEQCTYDKK